MLKNLKTKAHNRFYFFPSVKIRNLERVIKKQEAQLKKMEESSLDSIVELLKRADEFIAKGKVPKPKDYIRWKALLRKKKIIEIGCCEKCGSTHRLLTLDHIVPVDFLKSMGIDPNQHMDKRNFRLLCDLCNSRKGHYFDFTDPRTKPLLMEYIDGIPEVTKASSFPQPPY